MRRPLLPRIPTLTLPGLALRLVGSVGLALAAPALLQAQSYQTNFADVKFDRGASPATFHGGVEVDAPTGALNLTLPLGPGIGSSRLKWVPTLRGHWAPQGKVSLSIVGTSPTQYGEIAKINSNGGFQPIEQPGLFKLVFNGYASEPEDGTGPSMSALAYRSSNYEGPDGFSGSFDLIATFDPVTGQLVSGASLPVDVASVKGEAAKSPKAHEATDHYHRENPNSTGKHDQYLDKQGQPVRKFSDDSHLLPGKE